MRDDLKPCSICRRYYRESEMHRVSIETKYNKANMLIILCEHCYNKLIKDLKDTRMTYKYLSVEVDGVEWEDISNV